MVVVIELSGDGLTRLVEKWKVEEFQFTYNCGPASAAYKREFRSLDELAVFVRLTGGLWAIHGDGKEMLDGRFCGIKDWPIDESCLGLSEYGFD